MHLRYSNSWNKCKQLTARTSRLFLAGPSKIRDVIWADELQAAEALHFLVSSPPSLVAIQTGRLQSLGEYGHEGEVMLAGRVRPGICRPS